MHVTVCVCVCVHVWLCSNLPMEARQRDTSCRCVTASIGLAIRTCHQVRFAACHFSTSESAESGFSQVACSKLWCCFYSHKIIQSDQAFKGTVSLLDKQFFAHFVAQRETSLGQSLCRNQSSIPCEWLVRAITCDAVPIDWCSCAGIWPHRLARFNKKRRSITFLKCALIWEELPSAGLKSI